MSAAPDQAPQRPINSKFRQQMLPAWEPITSPTHVSACLGLIAIICISLGAAIVVANDGIMEIDVRYDHMHKCRSGTNEGAYTFAGFKQGCDTFVNFTVVNDMPGPVYMYYRLGNFFQNHRRYAKSRDSPQLSGKHVGVGSASSDCDPLLTPGSFWDNSSAVVDSVTIDGKTTRSLKYSDMQYSPCGLVAWSMFNDSFKLTKRSTNGGGDTVICDSSKFFRGNNSPIGEPTECHKKGIAWPSDEDTKFVVPGDLDANIWTGVRSEYDDDNNNKKASSYTSSDIYLQKGWYAFEPGHSVPIQTDEDLMVWMRTSSLPTFRKLHRIFPKGLKKGSYQMQIREFFDSTQFSGTKSFILSTVSWLGAKNTFLGAVYLVVGCLCLVLVVTFMVADKLTEARTQAAVDAVMGSR